MGCESDAGLQQWGLTGKEFYSLIDQEEDELEVGASGIGNVGECSQSNLHAPLTSRSRRAAVMLSKVEGWLFIEQENR